MWRPSIWLLEEAGFHAIDGLPLVSIKFYKSETYAMNLFFRMMFSVCNNSFEFLSFSAISFSKLTWINAYLPIFTSVFIIEAFGIIPFLFEAPATKLTSLTLPILLGLYLGLFAFQLVWSLLQVNIQATKQPFVSVFNAALNINYFFNLPFFCVEVRMMLSQTLSALDLLIARNEFKLFVETLVLYFGLSLGIVEQPFFLIQSFDIVYNILTLLIQLVQPFSLFLALLFSPRLLS